MPPDEQRECSGNSISKGASPTNACRARKAYVRSSPSERVLRRKEVQCGLCIQISTRWRTIDEIFKQTGTRKRRTETKLKKSQSREGRDFATRTKLVMFVTPKLLYEKTQVRGIEEETSAKQEWSACQQGPFCQLRCDATHFGNCGFSSTIDYYTNCTMSSPCFSYVFHCSCSQNFQKLYHNCQVQPTPKH